MNKILGFSDKAIDKINELIKRTKKNEIGAVLCLDSNGKINLEHEVYGSEYSIEIPLDCKHGRKHIGTFHTHPTGEIERISSSDYERAVQDIITCIGQKVNNKHKIKCMLPLILSDDKRNERNELINELSEIDFLINLGYSKEEIENIIRRSGIREKIDSYFNWINIG